MLGSQSNKASWLFIAIVTMMGILTLLPSDIYIPAMPMMKEDFGATTSQVQLTMSFFFLGAGLSQILAGPIIDSFNPKIITLTALVIFFITSLLCIFAPSINVLIAYRFLQAFSAGFVVVTSRAAVVKNCERADATRVFLIMSPIIAISPGVAPIIGGYLAKLFSWKASFVFISIFSGLLITWVYKYLHLADGSRIKFHPFTILKTYRKLFSNKNFNIYLSARSGIDASYFAYITASPFIFNAFGYSMVQIGNFYLLIALSYIAMTYVCKKLVNSSNMDKLMLAGLFISLGGVVLMAILNLLGFHSAMAIMVPAAIMTAGYGFSGPLSWSEAMAQFPDDAGSTSSLIGFCPLLASAFTAAIVNQVTSGSVIALSMFLFALLGVITVGLIVLMLGKKEILISQSEQLKGVI